MCHCDNQSVVAAVWGGYCKDPAMAHLLRCLFFLEVKFGFSLSAVHVSGKDNGAADAISRNKLDTFFNLVPQAHQPHIKRQQVWWKSWWCRDTGHQTTGRLG